ncbi:TIGR02117 family protein [Sphingosinicella sp. CPCC 101087]|uniref:TIGR02117 family protein n=1 Tax=Sphingosinicella sp. CPCC 101087 TaxID=2497754 RepID=UPI00101BF7E0|nr:TIGR02117 family protein [Sphingosinicella sp. CPCC 101087]
MGAANLWRRAIRVLLGSLVLLVAAPLAWLLAALFLGAIPANVAWTEPERGVTIFVRTNGVHTWLVMPKVNAIMDWRPYVPGQHLRDPRYGRSDHIAVGYGNREFYLNTPTWADLTPGNAFHAAFGNGSTLLHVEHDHQPRPDDWQRPITVTEDQYRRLAAYVRARFRLDAYGRTIPLRGRGYSAWDMFYEAKGGYSFVLTCNEWTGRALRAAGVRTGLWTPLSQSIMWRLD